MHRFSTSQELDFSNIDSLRAQSVQTSTLDTNSLTVGAGGLGMSQIQFGNPLNSGAVNGEYTVTFPTPFTTIPTVVVSLRRGSSFVFTASLQDIFTTSFTYRVTYSTIANPSQTIVGADTHTLNWIAIA